MDKRFTDVKSESKHRLYYVNHNICILDNYEVYTYTHILMLLLVQGLE